MKFALLGAGIALFIRNFKKNKKLMQPVYSFENKGIHIIIFCIFYIYLPF